MFKRFLSWIGQVVNKMIGIRSLNDVSESSVISNEMATAIDDWMNLYKGKAPWIDGQKQSLGLPELIASEIARLVTLEMEVNVSEDTERGKLIKGIFATVLSGIRNYVEYGCAGGGLMFKPAVAFTDNEKHIVVEYIQANKFVPTAFDSSGRITGAAFMEQKTIGKVYFTRIERHLLQGSEYTIVNTAYRSYSSNLIGTECPLSDCQDWAGIDPVVSFSGATAPLFAYFKIPLGNTIDPDSPLGVSVYARAVNLIRDADEQYQRLLWEFEGGELAIDVSSDAFIKDKVTKRPALPKGKERLFRMNELDGDIDEPFKEWSPTLRDTSLLNGLDTILVKIEDQCGLARGTLSNRFVEARTATEIIHTKQRSYATVSDIQTALENALNDLADAIDTLASLYKMTAPGKYEITYAWDDSIIVDAEAERLRDQQEVSQGLMLPHEYRMKWYGEDEKTALEKLTRAKRPSDDQILGFGNEPT